MGSLSNRMGDRLRVMSVMTLVTGVTYVAAPVYAQEDPTPTNQRVLVVYNTVGPDSLNVANYYMARRGIPESNKCAISPPDTSGLEFADFDSTVRTPVKNCLSRVGPDRILYIVFSYQTPYLISVRNYVYALDHSISDIWEAYSPPGPYPFPDRPHAYYAAAQTQGNVYPPFVSLADYRARSGGQRIYSVWRLDAPTAELAKGLVDKAIWAEANGLSGQGCFDRREDITGVFDFSYDAGDWDLFRAAEFARQAGFQVTEDDHEEEFGTPPAPLRCDNAAMYAGWYSLDHYNDAFTWRPGAMGFHLDSFSAGDPRGGSNWSANAVMRGITVTGGAVNEPYLEGLVHPDGFYRNLFEGASVGDAVLRNTAWLQWMIVNIGDPLYKPFPGGFPAFDQTLHPQSSLALGPLRVIGGNSSTGRVTLAQPAPTGGTLVTLTSSRPEAASVPDSVTVTEGSRSATFPITTSFIGSGGDEAVVLISATFGTERRDNTLVIDPFELAAVYPPVSMFANTQASGYVHLTGRAPAGGYMIALSSSNPAAVTVPSSVTVAAGEASSSFTLTAGDVTEFTFVTITASDGVVEATGTLYVEPR